MIPIRFRKWSHRKLLGHEPNYIIEMGVISGRPLLFCRICLREQEELQMAKKSKLKRKLTK